MTVHLHRPLLFALAAFAIGAIALAQPRASAETKIEVKALSGRSAEDIERLRLRSERVESAIRKMPLETKVRQLFMLGFAGRAFDQGLESLIRRHRPGGVIVFGRNIVTGRQITTMNLAAHALSRDLTSQPLLIATDQEGGDVARLKTRIPLASALAFGTTGDVSLARRAGHSTGHLLKTMGFNMNLAPVLDISDSRQRSFIGTRTYGSDPKIVAQLSLSFSEGLQQAGVFPTAKHFPGHGDLTADTHVEATSNPKSLEQLLKRDLVPYFAHSSDVELPSAVMLAHVAFPALDPSGLPATFSKPIVTGYLRDRVGFDGLVITDDIQMNAAAGVGDVGERAVRALEAGVDMIMLTWGAKAQTAAIAAVDKAVRGGRLSEARVNQSLRRILTAKEQYGPHKLEAPTPAELRFALRNPEFLEIGNAIVVRRMQGSITKSDRERLVGNDSNPVFVFSASDTFYRKFQQAVRTRPTRLYRLAQNLNFNIDRVMRSNPDAIGIFYLTGRRAAEIANTISDDVARRLLIINVASQGLLKKPQIFGDIADIYYRHPELGRLTGEYLFSAQPKDFADIRKPTSTDGRQAHHPGGSSTSERFTSPSNGAL